MWQPWETAPRDRRFIAAYMSASGPATTEAEYEYNRFRCNRIGFLAVNHPDALGWHDLPKPPSSPVTSVASVSFDDLMELITPPIYMRTDTLPETARDIAGTIIAKMAKLGLSPEAFSALLAEGLARHDAILDEVMKRVRAKNES